MTISRYDIEGTSTDGDRLALLHKLLGETVVVVGRDGRVLDASPSLVQLVGITAAQAISGDIALILGDVGAAELRDHVQGLAADERWTGSLHMHVAGRPESVLACSVGMLPDGSSLVLICDESDRRHRDEELLRRNREAVTLYEIGRQISASLDTQTMLEVIVRNITWLYECQFSAAILCEDERMPLTWRTVMGSRGSTQPDVPISRETWPWIHTAIERKREVVIQAGTGDILPEDLQTLIIVPVLRSGILLGLILIGYRYVYNARDEEVRLLLHLADQTAIAIENARLYQSAATVARRLKALAAHVTSVQEEERGRLSRELHDGIGQALTAVRFNMDILTREVPIKEGPSLDRVNAVKEIIDETLKEIRQMAFDLRPPALDELGLPSALRLYVSRFGQQAGIETQISTPPSLEIADKRVESVLYRVTQESLTNVARHASATLVAVRLGLHEGLLRLEIEDNGRGFILPQVSAPFSPGLGILGMKERVTDLGGSFVLSSQEGKGTHITVEIPQSQIL